jgi:hypothetical protein
MMDNGWHRFCKIEMKNAENIGAECVQKLHGNGRSSFAKKQIKYDHHYPWIGHGDCM